MAGARAVGAAVGGEAGALPASLHGGSEGSLHCNPVFSHALQHSQQVRPFSQWRGCLSVLVLLLPSCRQQYLG